MPDFAAIIAICLTMGIPIIAILTSHQRKMAEIIHRGNQGMDQINPQLMMELQALRAEVAQLRDTVNQQAIASDNLRTQLGVSSQVAPPSSPVSQSQNF